MSILMPVLNFLDYCSFVESFEIGKFESSNLVCTLACVCVCVCVVLLDPLHFHMNFRISLTVAS